MTLLVFSYSHCSNLQKNYCTQQIVNKNKKRHGVFITGNDLTNATHSNEYVAITSNTCGFNFVFMISVVNPCNYL